VPGFDTEDKNPSLGDPSTQTTTPLTKKQMQGAQAATVNRTQIPPGRGNVGAQPSSNGKTPDDANQNQDGKQSQDAGQQGSAQDTPILGGLEQLGEAAGRGMDASRASADQLLGINPAHNVDWWKHAVESPVESYYFGKHLYNAFYGAFLDPTAIQASVHDIWHQDNAVGWFFRNVVSYAPGPQQIPRALGMTTPEQAATAPAEAAAMGADPSNLLYMGAGARGAAMVAKFVLPSIANAIFTDAHSPTDLAWGVLPAIIFGGKLPPSVSAQVEKVAPGALKLIEKFSAAKMAQDANKTGIQNREKMLQELIQTGAMGPKNDVLAKAWGKDMEPLGKEAESQLATSLMEKYGTLDVDKLVPQMIREGVSPRMLQNVWTKAYRMPYELTFNAPAEAPLVDPRHHMSTLPAAAQQEMRDGFQWSAHMINQVHLGTSGHDVDPAVSRFRSLLGMQATNDLTEKMWSQHLQKLAGSQATNPQELDLLSRALESSGREQEVAYQALSPQMKAVRDEMRLVAAGIGRKAEEEGIINRVANYWPRVGLVVKDGKGFRPLRRAPRVLTTEPTVHRALKVTTQDLLTESRMQVEQAYATVKEANAAVTRQREYVAQSIINGTPWHEIAAETGAGIPETDYQLIEGMQQLVKAQPDVARMEAEDYAKRLIPEFSENPFDGIAKLGQQMRALTSRLAVQDLLAAAGKDGKALAVLRPRNDREFDMLRSQGYRGINVPGFQHVLVNDQYGKLLEDATKAKNLGAFKKVADLENQAVTMIMFSPRIHGMNMAARLGVAFAMHPMEVSRWFAEGLLQKGGLSQLGLRGVTQIGHDEMRMIPRRYGLVPPNPHTGSYGGGWADSYIAKAGELFADSDIGRVPLVRDMVNSSEVAKASSGAKQVLGTMRDLLWGKQSDLWSWVSDFGNMMWWIEHAAAQRGGMLGSRLSGEEAARYATARANSWMGHVAPFDWNPNVHAALKTVTFAPNWWRTWGELLTGYYRNQGFGWSSDTIKYVVENEIKTALAAVMFQQLSANALNMVLAGHTIYQNDPSNWGKIEITAPWAIEMLNATALKGNPIDPKTGRDAKGAKLTWENPLARQMVDTEQLMGLLTSSPKWTPDTLRQGFSSFAAARTSPVMQAIAALGNVDLYRSISADGLRYVDPNADKLVGNPFTDLLTAGGDLTPFSYISSQIQQQVMQGNVGEVQGPFGLPIPQAVTNAFNPGQLGQDAARSFLVGLTGTNPPFMRSSKSQGTSPTDDQYKTVHEIQDKYTQRMNALSTSTLSGQMAPYQWLATYRQLSAQHAAEMQAIFMHAPEYNNGPLGLTNSYEGLYDKATDQNGVLQADRLRSLQQQWRSEHSAADYAAVQGELRHNDSKYPMMALYHKTLDAYHNWQADWCTQNGVDLATLQSDMSGWSTVYNDRNASRQWVTDHPEITQFEAAKKAEFESGSSSYAEAGLMYALFFNPTAADRYLTTTGETPEQVEQAVQQEQVPAAP
jgi:hypothetical protein